MAAQQATAKFASNPINFNRLTTDDGLSHSYVYRILQDKQGFIWVATQDGLNRYDGHEFFIFRNDPDNPGSISGNDVRVVFEDSKARIWVGTQGKGLGRYNSATSSFTHFSFVEDNFFNSSNVIIEILEAKNGNFWIGTRGGLIQFNPETGAFKNFVVNPQRTGLGNQVRDLFWLDDAHLILATGEGLRIFNVETGENRLIKAPIDNFEKRNFGDFILDGQQNLWAGSIEGGLYRIPLVQLRRNQTSYPFELVAGSQQLGRIFSLYLDATNKVWVGTRSNGLYFYDQDLNLFQGYQYSAGENTSLSSNTIMDIYQDNTGLFWIGTWSGGINTFNLDRQAFRNFSAIPFKKQSLSGKNIWDLMRTSDGHYWFGTNDGGLTRYNPDSDHYDSFIHDEADPSSLSGNQVWSLGERKDGLLWIGTYFSGVNLFDPKSGKVLARYNQKKDKNAPYPHAAINMYQTSDGSWWFATRLQGLARWNEKTRSFKFYRPNENDPNALSGIKVFALFEDSQNRFWIGTENSGLSLYRPDSDDFESFRSDQSNLTSIVSDEVLSISEDSQGRLLVGTEQGLSRMESKGVFSHITKKEGLINDTINGILKDCNGDVWVATNQSLSKIDKQDKIVNFSKKDGLISTEFNTTAFQYGKGCELLFGAAQGAVSFVPKSDIADSKADIMLSKVLKYYEPVKLKQPLNTIEELKFSYRDQVVSFAFALVDYNNPGSHEFRYRLLDDESFGQWIHLGKQNLVSLTNLAPGEHLLEVKGVTEKGIWSDIKQIRILVTPPWWQTWWAYLGYILTSLIIILGYVRLQTQKLKAQKLLTNKEREVARELRQVDKLKDQFLANTSHEIRTPLNAIIGLSDIAIMENAQKQADTEIDSTLKLIRESGERLLTLVSDILDYSALAENKLRVSKEALSIEPVINNLILEVQLLNQNSDVEIIDRVVRGLPLVYADEHRLYQILLNLLSNALKFTERGTVEIFAEESKLGVKVTVKDSGIGIPEDKLANIFNRFEQLDASLTRERGGTGLGLAITKELVELHEGTITVKSEVGVGTAICVEIPRA